MHAHHGAYLIPRVGIEELRNLGIYETSWVLFFRLHNCIDAFGLRIPRSIQNSRNQQRMSMKPRIDKSILGILQIQNELQRSSEAFKRGILPIYIGARLLGTTHPMYTPCGVLCLYVVHICFLRANRLGHCQEHGNASTVRLCRRINSLCKSDNDYTSSRQRAMMHERNWPQRRLL